METTLSLVAAKALPGLMSQSLTYNAEKNCFLTQGWASLIGNFYYQVIRGTKSLAIFFGIGEGQYLTFLNSIAIYSFDGNKPRLIAKREWGGCDNWRAFSEEFAKQNCIEMLQEFLMGEAKRFGYHVEPAEVSSFAANTIEQVYQKRLA